MGPLTVVFMREIPAPGPGVPRPMPGVSVHTLLNTQDAFVALIPAQNVAAPPNFA